MAVNTTNVSWNDFTSLGFKHPAKWFVKNAMGDYVYIHCRKRDTAQEQIDEMYGKGRYTVRAAQ